MYYIIFHKPSISLKLKNRKWINNFVVPYLMSFSEEHFAKTLYNISYIENAGSTFTHFTVSKSI